MRLDLPMARQLKQQMFIITQRNKERETEKKQRNFLCSKSCLNLYAMRCDSQEVLKIDGKSFDLNTVMCKRKHVYIHTDASQYQ